MHYPRFLLCVSALFLPLTAAQSVAAEPVSLFNGEDLSGWTFDCLDETVAMGDVWSVEEGILKNAGNPKSVLRTEAEFARYKLELEWRWPGEGGNSGVLVHSTDPQAKNVWPRSLEVQLMSENAGDFWVIGCEAITPPESFGVEDSVKGRRHINFNDGAEKPLGEWNAMTVHVDGPTVLVTVNGEIVNYCRDSTATAGAICLQSEGTPVEFRNIVLTPFED
ncbi:MAG: DUF1080 domain-containing protein [Planctomycetota bacterium]